MINVFSNLDYRSPFPKFEMNGKLYEPGQGNNAYIFPGVALGVICTGIYHIADDVS